MQTKLNAMTLTILVFAIVGFAAPTSASISDDVVKIGIITDMSGLYVHHDGPGGVEAIRMAAADFGGSVNGKKIDVVYADHQNKADIAAATAREWFDRKGVDMLIGGTNSSANLAMAKVAAEKKKPFISIGAATARLTNEECTPYTVHYAYDTVALAKGTGATMTLQGGREWFFLTADYAFGPSLEKDTTNVIMAHGGRVVGSVKHPLDTADFSPFLLQAQSSKPQVLALANAGGDVINAIKTANELGITRNTKLAALLVFITDIHSLGLDLTQGLYLTTGWYWDLNDVTRAWAKRYFVRMNKMPTMLQAADYSATIQYLNAVKVTGTDAGDKIMAQLKNTKIDDVFARNGVIRPDGRMVHDMYLMQVKKPSESKYPWDYYKIVQTIPGDQAFASKAESKCSFWK